MGSSHKEIFRDVQDAVESCYGQFRFRRINNNFHNSTIGKKEVTPKEFIDAYKRENENRGLGSNVHYDFEGDFIWSFIENPDEKYPCVYFLKLPKSLSERLYRGVRRILKPNRRSAPSGI